MSKVTDQLAGGSGILWLPPALLVYEQVVQNIDKVNTYRLTKIVSIDTQITFLLFSVQQLYSCIIH